ncbi:MAG: type II CAAX endopeptidase family protein [Anaerolineaceae bacterium]|nr:type II CAAX endopeptidase family protein [Anaerolineaceae bacterium]
MATQRIRNEIFTFLGLTLGLSAIFYTLIITGGGLEANGGVFVLGLMWSPGLSALIARLIFHHNLKGMGWKAGKPRYLLMAYGLPILYAGVVYGLVWWSGLGGIRTEILPSPVYLLVFATLGVVQSALSALGEEIGWRGLLVPQLARLLGYPRTALVSGVIWALWHTPLIVFADYNSGATPTWYALLCFWIMVMGISFVFAWLVLRSGSLWPAVILHAAHNLFIQGLFDPLTTNTGPTAYLTGEFGIGLAIAGTLLALIFWRLSNRLPQAAVQATPAEAG